MTDTTVLRPAVLRVNGLKVWLPGGGDRAFAVTDVQFDVRAAETVCLVGESGSGKSVIAQAIMGLLPIGLQVAAGSIELNGEDITRAGARRLRQLRGVAMSMVFQEPMTALNPVMTCGSQLDELLVEHTRDTGKQRHRRILEALARVALPDPARICASYPHQLSGGQRQRIVIAIALLLKASLLICDEPTTALDVTTQAEVLKLIRELQVENGTAVLFITHDFGVVSDIADRIVVMQAGAIVENGDRHEVLVRPRAAYTRMLLDAVPTLSPSRRPEVHEGSPLLQAVRLSKQYVTKRWFAAPREVTALKNVSVSVRAGETLGIVGESGSGKSTLARCLVRLIKPSGGRIAFDGLEVPEDRGRALSSFRQNVQIVFQDPYRSLNPRRSVGDSIVEGLINGHTPARVASARAEELMRLVGLSPSALNRKPSEFSGGQRQRICIARALACEPRVLIADEAVSALDVSVQSQILTLLEDIQARLGVAIVFITHDLRVASRICDRVVVMRGGEIVEEGLVRDVFEAPRHSYTQSLLAAAPGRMGFAR